MYNVIGMFRNSKGFTLIELVITMGLLAILSAATISFIGLQPQRTARDTRRKADLQTYASAFEMYRNDCSAYPSSLGGLPAAYLANQPKDPKTGGAYSLTACPGGSTITTACGAGLCRVFSVCATLETNGTPANFCVNNP
jgi:prepilin-type N-terminal cleavage/methylation domain-containing protein